LEVEIKKREREDSRDREIDGLKKLRFGCEEVFKTTPLTHIGPSGMSGTGTARHWP
jgi:hypothetical protein